MTNKKFSMESVKGYMGVENGTDTEKHLAPAYFFDEYGPSDAETRDLGRLSMRETFFCGWPIGERFDDRYDTEVGGNQLLVSQSINENGEIEGGLPPTETIEQLTEIPKQSRPSGIMDYQEGKYYSLEEAEAIPEMARVVERLKERIAEYADFLQSRGL